MKTPESGVNRLNCVTGELWDGYSPPGDCWTIKFPRFGSMVLSVLPAKRAPGCARESKWIQVNNSLYREFIDLLEKDDFCVVRVSQLIEKYGSFRVQELAKCCEELEMHSVFREGIGLSKKRKRKKNVDKKKGNSSSLYLSTQLPADLNEVFKAWVSVQTRRFERIVSAGGKYSAGTVRRNKNEAHRFLAFALQCGVEDWNGINQSILDRYVSSHGTSAGQKAYTFIRYGERLLKRYRRFIRARSKRSDINKILLDDDKFFRAIRKIEETGSDELILIFYLMSYYAQTLDSCLDLKSTDFQITPDGEVEVLFNELWIRLQGRSKDAFHNYAISHGHIVWGNEVTGGQSLFEASRVTYYRNIRKSIGPIVKELRATAVLNMSKVGYLDRRTIHMALGVSVAQVEYIQRVCGWAFNSYVSDEGSEKLKDLMGIPS